MSDTMLFGVLRMPYEMAMSDELSRFQFYDRAQEAIKEIERLRDDVAQLRDLLEELEACREGSRVAHAELRTLKAKIEAAEVHIVSEMPGSAFGLIALEPGMVGKRVRLVVEEG